MRILLVQTGFLGDVILSTPVISNLKKLYPDAQIVVLTTPLAHDLVSDHPDVSSVITYDKRGSESGVLGLVRMASRLRAFSFDLVFSLHKSYRTALVLKLSGIKKRYGFSEASASFLYSTTVRRSDLAHEVLRNLAILRAVNVNPLTLRETRMRIGLSEQAVQRSEEVLSHAPGARLVGIAPGSVWATKRWTIEGFIELAHQLAARGNSIVLLGGPSDRAIAEELERGAGIRLLNLVGDLSLIESAAVVNKLSLLISNDSAPLHMASAMQTPVLALFCATVPEFGFGPWQVDHEILEVKGLSCRPCGRHGGNTCPTGTFACMKNLKAAHVLVTALRMLERNEKSVGGLNNA